MTNDRKTALGWATQPSPDQAWPAPAAQLASAYPEGGPGYPVLGSMPIG
jgi:hypothetical protein